MIKQTEAQNIGRAGERWFQGLIPREWIFQKPEEDIGLDGKIIIGTDKSTGSFEFGVQIKSSKNWDIRDGVISVEGIKADTLLFWGSRLYPTLVVLYDVSKEVGYCGWAFDIISQAIEVALPYSQKINPKTVTLKMLATSVLSKHKFQELRYDVEKYYLNLVNSLSAVRKSINILPVVNKLLESVRGLHFSHVQQARTKEQQMLIGMMMVSSHKQVIETLRALQDKYHIEIGSTNFIQYFISNYINKVNMIIHDFASILNKAEPFVIWVNPEAHRTSTPKVVDMILDFILLLTDEKPRERGTVFSFK
jgi:hypothetical protein